MWTHSGFFIERKYNKNYVHTCDEEELRIFADDHGILDDFFIKQNSDVKKTLKEDGLYQVWVGYGPIGSMQDPGIYDIKFIAEIDWTFGGKHD